MIAIICHRRDNHENPRITTGNPRSKKTICPSNHLTLESLAKRVEALEKVISTKNLGESRKVWRKVVGMFRDSEFMRSVDEECLRIREAQREAARRGDLAE